MNPGAIAWLNQFAMHPLNDRQRLALVYLRANEQIANRDYQRLNRVDSVIANRELRRLVESGLIEQHSTRRWAYYTLSALTERQAAPTEEEMVLRYVQKKWEHYQRGVPRFAQDRHTSSFISTEKDA